ncbi:MAG: PAS domain S-box protein [Desulfobacteraceae bacterium]|nr:PAS domain S-box protein [Desulfobacteraceae bacterium]
MGNPHEKINEALKSISQPKTTKGFTKEITNDALSIVVDAINSSIGGIIITDLEDIIRFANPAFCKMFDYVLTEIIGKNAAELFSNREIKKIIDVLSIIEFSRNSTEDFIVERKDRGTFFVEVSASSVTSVTGERIGRMASFIDITKRKILEADLDKKLKEALDQLKILRGVLPICASCKRIRDDKGCWHQIESYIKKHSEADFSHGICPDCAKKLYPEFHK